MKSFIFQYGQVDQTIPVSNQTTGTQEYINAVTYNPAYHFVDAIINVDLAGPGSYTENSVVHIENALSNPYKTTFTDQGAPSGAKTDYFRYSFYNSTTSWNADAGKGTMLNRVYFDRGQADNYRTEYFDPKSQEGSTLILTNRYNDQNYQISNRYARLGVELMRPDEAVDGAVEVEDSVYISNMQACFTAERTTTWQMADQDLDGGCSTGSNLQYRWQATAGGPFSDYSTNSTFDFPGHNTTGSHTVTLEIRDPSTGGTTSETKQIEVEPGQDTVSGPTLIMDKQTKNYASNGWSYWHERPLGSQTWSPGAGPGYNYSRIWPAGDYIVDLRADASTSSTLRRGRLQITVCTGYNCYARSAGSAAPLDRSEWSLLGGGPVFSTGTMSQPAVWQFYELTGGHEPNSPFSDASWFEQSDGSSVATEAATIVWERDSASSANVRAFNFAVAPVNSALSYVFGFAWDPDLGAPADDRSGYDTDRNLIYAYDDTGAVGILLMSSNGNELASVEQFGASKWPPTSTNDVYTRQRDEQIKLITEAGDVQFILGGKAATGNRTWRVAFVKGSTVSELKANTDTYLKR